jgi:histidinol-phosphate aminotransferase
VIVDEAYSDFSSQKPFRFDIHKYPNLIVLATFSKAWGAAGIRLGMAFASTDIIGLYNKVKYPYNVNVLTQKKAMEILGNATLLQRHITMILEERETLMRALSILPICKKVYPTDANFILARVTDADGIYRYLVQKGVIVRNRNRVHLCGDCLRITVGIKEENTKLLSALRQYV